MNVMKSIKRNWEYYHSVKGRGFKEGNLNWMVIFN